MLNETVKRHLQYFGERYMKGERTFEALKVYIFDCGAQGLVVPTDAKEIYDTFTDYSYVQRDHVRDSNSNTYKAQISIIKHIIEDGIEDGIDSNHPNGE